MDDTLSQGCPLTTGPIRRSARLEIFKKKAPQLEMSASIARQLYDSNLNLPPKKRIRVSSTLFELNSEFKMMKMTTLPLEETKYRKKPPPKPPILVDLPMSEALAENIMRRGGEKVKKVMQKQLLETDIATKNGRLSIPNNKIKNEFLSEIEKTILSQYVPYTKTMRGIDVLVLDPRLEEWNLCLKKWKMNNVFVCNLVENWNKLVEENKLEFGDTIQLWTFRVEERRRRGLSDLCFALVKLEHPNNGVPVVDDSSTSIITGHDEN